MDWGRVFESDSPGFRPSNSGNCGQVFAGFASGFRGAARQGFRRVSALARCRFGCWVVACASGFSVGSAACFPAAGFGFFGLWSRGFFEFFRGLPSRFPRFSGRFPGF